MTYYNISALPRAQTNKQTFKVSVTASATANYPAFRGLKEGPSIGQQGHLKHANTREQTNIFIWL
jgi:hypothetical protein